MAAWIASAILLPAAGRASSLFTDPQLSVQLIAEQSSIAAGEPFTAGLNFSLKPGWHIYWINPGGSGLPTKVQWQLPPGAMAGDIQWPVPQKVSEPGVTLYGYTQSVLLAIPLQPGNSLTVGQSANLIANVDWTVCREVCIPGKARLDMTVPVQAHATANMANAARFDLARKSLPSAAPSSWSASAKAEGDGFVLEVITGKPEQSAEFFSIAPNQIDESAPQKFESRPQGMYLHLVQSDFMSSPPMALRGLLVTSTGLAFSLEAPITQGAGGSPSPTASLAPEAGSGLNKSQASGAVGALARTSIVAALGLAFLGGLILNLMPCVLPVLSLKVLGLAEIGHSETRAARMHGLFYLLGILASFWVLASVLMLLRAGGHQVGWGFQMQSPAFVVGLTALMFLLALNLLGLFEIAGSWMGAGSSLAARSGYSGSFFTGVLATAVATPCTAPFMGVAIGFALTQSLGSIFVIFSALALGLAAPYVLLSFKPSWGARFLPRPGAWMIRFKQAMSFPLFGAAIWLLWVLGQEQGINAAALLLVGLLLMSIAVWSRSLFKHAFVRNAVTLALVISGLALPLAISGPAIGATGKVAKPVDSLPWEKFTPEKLAEYRSKSKPVFVDFSAAWCVTCQINERIVLKTAEIQKALSSPDIALLKADWTSYDPGITAALSQHGRVGVPFYLFYGKSSTPLIESEVLTSRMLIGALDEVRAQH